MSNESTTRLQENDSNSSQPMDIDREQLVISEKVISEPTTQSRNDIETNIEKESEPELQPQCNLQRTAHSKSLLPIQSHDSKGYTSARALSPDSREQSRKLEQSPTHQLQFEHRSPPKGDRRGYQEKNNQSSQDFSHGDDKSTLLDKQEGSSHDSTKQPSHKTEENRTPDNAQGFHSPNLPHQEHTSMEVDTHDIHCDNSTPSQEQQLSTPRSQEPLVSEGISKSPPRHSIQDTQSVEKDTLPNSHDAGPSTSVRIDGHVTKENVRENAKENAKESREVHDTIMTDRRPSFATAESCTPRETNADDVIELDQHEHQESPNFSTISKSKRSAEELSHDAPDTPASKEARTKRGTSKRLPKVYPPRKPRIRPVAIEPLTMTIRTDSALSTLASAAAAIKDGQGRFSRLSAPLSPSTQDSQEREDSQDPKDSQPSQASQPSKSPEPSQELQSSSQTPKAPQPPSPPSELPSAPPESKAAPATIPKSSTAPENTEVTVTTATPATTTTTAPRLGRTPAKGNSNAPHDASGYRCELCPGERFGRVHDLKRHQISKHNEMTWPCDFCHRPFVRRDALLRHYSVKAARRDGVHPTEQEENRLQEAKARAKLHS
ncbi:hypothetical protein BGZ76_006440 [Entomortierella beljakovae]|nr:hypothetical protein BGZ76_006440 [Entomortierella beljakovae]